MYLAFLAECFLGISPADRSREKHPVACPEMLHSIAYPLHHTGGIIARSERQGGQSGIGP
jgi:hypothetical protein